MVDRSQLDIHIPVPWSSSPVRIAARGVCAVVASALVGIAALVVILVRH